MIDNIKEYRGVVGVWAIRGKIKENGGWVWLNVAKKDDIGDEIEEDIMFMSKNFKNPIQEKRYISKWNVELNSYEEFKYSPRRVAVRKTIAKYLEKSCEGFEVVLISRDDSKKMGVIEREFAFYTKAIFWSDGRRYTCSEREIEDRRNRYIRENKIDDKLKNIQYKIIYSTV